MEQGEEREEREELRAQEEELSGIADGLRAVGKGFMEFVSDFNQPDAATEFGLIRRVVERSGRPAVFSLTQRHDRTEVWKELLALSNKAAREGVPIRPVFPPRPIGILMGSSPVGPTRERAPWQRWSQTGR